MESFPHRYEICIRKSPRFGSIRPRDYVRAAATKRFNQTTKAAASTSYGRKHRIRALNVRKLAGRATAARPRLRQILYKQAYKIQEKPGSQVPRAHELAL
jgi:hypothetical protein